MNNPNPLHYAFLAKYLSKPFPGDTPFLDSRLGSVYVNMLPEHTDGIWQEQFDKWPALVAQLWLLKACDHIAEANNILRKKHTSTDPVVEISTDYTQWVRTLQPYWTPQFIDWLQACNQGNDLLNIIKPVDRFSNIVRDLLLGDDEKQKCSMLKITAVSVVNMFQTNRQHHQLSLQLARRLATSVSLSDAQQAGYAHAFLSWGLRGLDEDEAFTQRERDWWALGYFHEKNEDTDPTSPLTKERLVRLHTEAIAVRVHLFNELHKLTPTTDQVHPSLQSEMQRWVNSGNVKAPPTFFDSARAFFPEKYIDLVNLENLDFGLHEAVTLISQHYTSPNTSKMHIPEDLTP